MTKEYQRVRTIRPSSGTKENFITPIHNNSGDVGAEQEGRSEEIEEDWGKVVRKIGELENPNFYL